MAPNDPVRIVNWEELLAGISVAGGIVVVSNGGTVSMIPTITAGAYIAGDNVGGLITFADAALAVGGGGVLKDMVIVDDAGQDAELELWLFNQTFTAGADNAPWAPSEADLENLITVITTADIDYLAAGTPSVVVVEIAKRFDCIGTSLFGRLVTRGTPTYAATDDLTVKLMFLQD